MISRTDRITACLLAGALGDAIGSHFENRPHEPNAELPASLYVSDDTQLTMATCESIIDATKIDPEHLAATFVTWFRQRRITRMGASTLKALTELSAGGHWALVGASGERAAGNGAAMRIAPLAFFLRIEDSMHRRLLRDVCRITHRNDEAYAGALAVACALQWILAGEQPGPQLLAKIVRTLPDSQVRERLVAIQEKSVSIDTYVQRFGCTGFVADSVPLALLAFTQSSQLLETMLALARCGGDADTNAMLFGQLFGAANGSQCLPMDLIAQIEEQYSIRDLAHQLASLEMAGLEGVG